MWVVSCGSSLGVGEIELGSSGKGVKETYFATSIGGGRAGKYIGEYIISC